MVVPQHTAKTCPSHSILADSAVSLSAQIPTYFGSYRSEIRTYHGRIINIQITWYDGFWVVCPVDGPVTWSEGFLNILLNALTH